MNHRPFITDLGFAPKLRSESEEQYDLGRYGVWVYDTSRLKYQVAATSNDLDALQKKYGPDLEVCPLPGGTHV